MEPKEILATIQGNSPEDAARLLAAEFEERLVETQSMLDSRYTVAAFRSMSDQLARNQARLAEIRKAALRFIRVVDNPNLNDCSAAWHLAKASLEDALAAAQEDD